MYLSFAALNPAYKFAYFKKIGWSSYEIEEAKQRVREVWRESYKPARPPSTQRQQASDFDFDYTNVTRVLWGNCSSDEEEEDEEDDFDRFFGEKRASLDLVDALGWWAARSHDFPDLSKMVRDYFAIQATSVAVERYFSSASHVTTSERPSLKATTTSKLQELKEFLKFGGDELFNYLITKMTPLLVIDGDTQK